MNFLALRKLGPGFTNYQTKSILFFGTVVVVTSISDDEIQSTIAEMEVMIERYGKALFRLPMTVTEIFPVGLLISLIKFLIACFGAKCIIFLGGRFLLFFC